MRSPAQTLLHLQAVQIAQELTVATNSRSLAERSELRRDRKNNLEQRRKSYRAPRLDGSPQEALFTPTRMLFVVMVFIAVQLTWIVVRTNRTFQIEPVTLTLTEPADDRVAEGTDPELAESEDQPFVPLPGESRLASRLVDGMPDPFSDDESDESMVAIRPMAAPQSHRTSPEESLSLGLPTAAEPHPPIATGMGIETKSLAIEDAHGRGHLPLEEVANNLEEPIDDALPAKKELAVKADSFTLAADSEQASDVRTDRSEALYSQDDPEPTLADPQDQAKSTVDLTIMDRDEADTADDLTDFTTEFIGTSILDGVVPSTPDDATRWQGIERYDPIDPGMAYQPDRMWSNAPPTAAAQLLPRRPATPTRQPRQNLRGPGNPPFQHVLPPISGRTHPRGVYGR